MAADPTPVDVDRDGHAWAPIYLANHDDLQSLTSLANKSKNLK